MTGSFLSTIRDFNNQWTILTSVSLILWCFFWVRPRVGTLGSSLLCYAGLSSIWVWVLSNNRYLTMDGYTAQALKYSAADSFGKLILILLPMLLISKSPLDMRVLGELAGYAFVLFNSVWIAGSLIQGCYVNENACGGLIGNPSIGVGLMVCILPIFIHSWRKQWKVLSLAVLSVIASKSSIAFGLLAVYAFLYHLPAITSARSFAKVSLAGALGCAVMGVGRLALGANLTNDSDRFRIWKFMMERWAAPWNIPAGTGLGSYHVFSINLQRYAQDAYPNLNIGTNYWWNSMHNEPLEFLFVCGIAGLVLFLATYFVALKNALDFDFRLAIGIVLYGLYMTLDPALHNPLPALFGAWLFVYALTIPRHPITYRRLT